MAAGTTGLTKILDQIVANAGAVAGLSSARVYQGRKVFTDAENFESIVKALTTQSQGALGIWLVGWDGQKQSSPSVAEIGGIILVPLAKNSSSDCNTMYDFIHAIIKAIMAESTYQAIAGVPLSFRVIETSDDYEDGIGAFELTLTFQVPLFCGEL